MVTISQPAELDALFAALADPTRRAIVARLAEADRTVGELAEPFTISRPAVSKHLDVLERAGLVHRRAEGRTNRCTLDAAPLARATAWMQRYRSYWEGQLDRLTQYLESDEEGR
jgi:DNA-binding transcriptional ArsR family regulator